MSETSNSAAIKNRMTIPLFKPGKGDPSIFSAGDMNRIVRAVNALLNPSISWGETDDPQITDGNFRINLSRKSPTSDAGSSAVAKMYILLSVQESWVTARSWDGVNIGDTDILIAKEYKNQFLNGEIIFGIEHTYTYSAGPDELNVIRTNSDGTNTETEIIVPPWVPGEIIYAIPAQTDLFSDEANTRPIQLLMIRSCQWAKYP